MQARLLYLVPRAKVLVSALLASTLPAIPVSVTADIGLQVVPKGVTIPVFEVVAPTVVITHGIQSIDPAFATPSWVIDMATAMYAYQILNSGSVDPFNVLSYTWQDAFVCLGPCGNNPLDTLGWARQADLYTAEQGFTLARDLLNQGISGDLHLIGHSMGTHVNSFAALVLNGLGISISQITILDRPFGDPLDAGFAGPTDDELFKAALPSVTWVDNWYGTNNGAVGAPLGDCGGGGACDDGETPSDAGAYNMEIDTINKAT